MNIVRRTTSNKQQQGGPNGIRAALLEWLILPLQWRRIIVFQTKATETDINPVNRVLNR